jgi:hypothetical protein
MERTLTRTWLASDKRGVEASLVQRALEMLRDRLAQHAADWGDGDGGRGEGGGSMARVAPVGQGRAAGSTPALGTGLPGGPPLDEAQLWRLVRRTPLRAAPMLTYVDVRVRRVLVPPLAHAAVPPAIARGSLLAEPRPLGYGRRPSSIPNTASFPPACARAQLSNGRAAGPRHPAARRTAAGCV